MVATLLSAEDDQETGMRLPRRVPWVFLRTTGAVSVSFQGPNYKTSSLRQVELNLSLQHSDPIKFKKNCELWNSNEPLNATH